MTQNDIAYYNARKEAKDARLKRRETKRHNLASEATERTKAAASYLGSEASMRSADAALTNAATNRSNYELAYAKEYGISPGSEYFSGYYDVDTGEMFVFTERDPSHEKLQGYRMWTEARKDDIILTVPVDASTGMVPNSYMQTLVEVTKTQQDVKKTKADIVTAKTQQVKNVAEAVKSGAGGVNVIVDTISNIAYGKDERNKGGK